MKPSFKVLLALLLLLTLPSVVQAQFTFTTNGGAITLTGYTGTNAVVVIPGSTNGYSVTSIGNSAFQSKGVLIAVTIPNSVTNIGYRAFYGCTALKSVTFGNSVNNIGSYAFSGCQQLTNITIPSSVSTLGIYAFAQCSRLTIVSGGAGMASIGDYAFYACPLTGLVIGNNVTNIGYNALWLCTSLTAITVGASNPVYSSSGGVLFDKGGIRLIWYPGGKVGPFEISNNVSIVESNAFYDCLNLSAVTIPYSVTNIGTQPFAECMALTTITVGAANPSYSSLDGVLFDKGQRALLKYPCGRAGGYTVPETVTTISATAFQNARLTDLAIGNGVTNIASWACSYCFKLGSVTIGSSVAAIGSYAFYNSSMVALTIPRSVTSIGSYAFAACYSLLCVYVEGNAPTEDGSVFSQDQATVYYLPGTLGWKPIFDGRPTALWFLPDPLILINSPSFGVKTNQFGFTISWATNLSVVVEICTNLATHSWSPVSTNTLTNGSIYFSDSQWTNYRASFYRIRSP
jgi:hypothetical protein